MRCVGGEVVPVCGGAWEDEKVQNQKMSSIGFLSIGLMGATDLKTGLKG
jgi:hypothetical protein